MTATESKTTIDYTPELDSRLRNVGGRAAGTYSWGEFNADDVAGPDGV